MKRKLSVLLVLAVLVNSLTMFSAIAEAADLLYYTPDNGQEMLLRKLSGDLFEGWGGFDSEESLEHFTAGGYLVEGDYETKLSEASAYWRYNENGYVEALSSMGSTSNGSLLTFVELNGGDAVGEEKMYYFSMRIYTAEAQTVRIAWNATKTKQFWSIYSGTKYGGRYPDYGSASSTLDNDNAIENNAAIYAPGGWHTIDGYMITESDARYFMLNCRYLCGTSSSPTLLDDIVLYEVEPGDAAGELFTNDYIVYDSLPDIDGYWTDSAGFVTEGVYERPEVGGVDVITANYTNGDTESFTVEVVGEKMMDDDGGLYLSKGENLVKNASFEHYETDNRSDGDTYPFIYTWESTITGSNSCGINSAENGCFAINNNEYVTGKASMRVRYSDAYNNHSSFNQLVELKEGTYYFSYYARRSTSDKRNLEIRLNGEVVKSFYDRIISPEWNKYCCVFEAGEGDVFEFTGYNVSSVYIDAVMLINVEKLESGAVVNIRDTEGSAIKTIEINSLSTGALFVYEYPLFVENGDVVYVYRSGAYTIESLSGNKEENVLNLNYEKIDNIESILVYVQTPHHVAPSLPELVTVEVNGRNVTAAVSWEDIEPLLYEKEGESFSVEGTVASVLPATAYVTVVENNNYLEGILSTDNFTTIKGVATKSNMCEITLDLLPLASRIDGVIAFTGDNVSVNAWNSCAIVLRMYTDGRMQYYNGSEGYVWSNAFYSRNIAYSIRILADMENKTYSAYLSQKGSYYGTVICENADFRADAPEISNIAQCLARGGASAEAGEFIVANVFWGDCEKVSFIRSFMGDDGRKNVVLQANETGEATAYYAAYEDGCYIGRETYELSFTKGERFTLLLEEADNRKLIMIDDMLVPKFVAVELEADYPRSFTTSFMGSFSYYATPYNSSLTDDDPGIVQVTIMEMYSDRITLTTKNYGEYTGAEAELEPYTIARANGDDSQVDEPIMRALLFGDYQIGDYLLCDEENEPVRPVFLKMINDLKDTDFDAVVIGGDLTYSGYVTEERCEYVVQTVLGLLKENISPNIYIIAGNHDYNAGESNNYNSADYYNWYMKENLGSLEENGNGYFETSAYYDGDVLVAFCYELDGVYFVGLSTSPDMMRGSLQNTNYNYTEGAMDWIESKLEEIGEDKTVFLAVHFPLNNSNNILKSSKGMGTDCTYRMIDILKDYPNLVYLYGHDHGSSYAYIDTATEERVTIYDMGGYKMN